MHGRKGREEVISVPVLFLLFSSANLNLDISWQAGMLHETKGAWTTDAGA